VRKNTPIQNGKLTTDFCDETEEEGASKRVVGGGSRADHPRVVVVRLVLRKLEGRHRIRNLLPGRTAYVLIFPIEVRRLLKFHPGNKKAAKSPERNPANLEFESEAG